MKIFAILLLLATNAYADSWITGPAHTVIIDGKPKVFAIWESAVIAADNESRQCDCSVQITSKSRTVGQLKSSSSSSGNSSSAQSSTPSITLNASPPTAREDGTELPVSEYGGYILRVNDTLIDIPKASADPLVYPITFPVAKTDIITIAFYDKAKLTSDFVPVTF